ncbi:hypothetical protein BG004_008195 [Podila humilis]|nr:hypothetical protein BG004_008195 [Podila humilis]
MSTTDFQSRFKTNYHKLEASAPKFQLACNIYTRRSPSHRNEEASPILFTHANGFHKEIWEPVIARMSPRWTAGSMYSFDCRNQGDSAVLNKEILDKDFDWYWYAHDILKVVDTFRLKNTIAVGHSFGASAFFLAEAMRPGTFSTIIAVDPTNFPRELYKNLPLADHPMGQITMKRRDKEAKAQLLQKKFFKAWHPEVLDSYIEYGMVDVLTADGSMGITLKCPKYQEAVTFAHIGNGLADAFEAMDKLDIPVHLLTGEVSDINQPALVELKMARLKYGTLDVVKGAGHLVTLEKPQESADIISAHLDRICDADSEQDSVKARL